MTIYHLWDPLQLIPAQVHSALRITTLVIVWDYFWDSRTTTPVTSACSVLRQATDGALSGATACYQPACQLNGPTRQDRLFIRVNILDEQALAVNNFLFVTTACLCLIWVRLVKHNKITLRSHLSCVPTEPSFSFFVQKSGELCR